MILCAHKSCYKVSIKAYSNMILNLVFSQPFRDKFCFFPKLHQFCRVHRDGGSIIVKLFRATLIEIIDNSPSNLTHFLLFCQPLAPKTSLAVPPPSTLTRQMQVECPSKAFLQPNTILLEVLPQFPLLHL